MKGIILAGGKGTRLYPMTQIVSKQLQPLYNKPMIYYPLSTLILGGIREILIISDPAQLPHYKTLLKDGSQWGLSIEYAEQAEPKGIAQALTIGKDFIGDDSSLLFLGDNFIYGRLDFLRKAIAENTDGATVFAYQVGNPSAFGVVEFDANGTALSIEEKPLQPKSNWAIPGIYVYGPGVSQRAENLTPSARGELEITDLNRTYLDDHALKVQTMGRGIAWLDTGTPAQLLEASHFIKTIEEGQGLIIGSPEEAAYRSGFISKDQLAKTLESLPNCPYRDYLQKRVLTDNVFG